jgi:hypothetical protein
VHGPLLSRVGGVLNSGLEPIMSTDMYISDGEVTDQHVPVNNKNKFVSKI